MPPQVKQIRHSDMGTQRSLGLPDRFKLPHPSLPHPGRLMGLLCPVVGILRIIVDNIWHQLTVSNAITTQLIRNDFPGLALVTTDQSLEEPLRRSLGAYALTAWHIGGRT
jgi:hypothetical protein